VSDQIMINPFIHQPMRIVCFNVKLTLWPGEEHSFNAYLCPSQGSLGLHITLKQAVLFPVFLRQGLQAELEFMTFLPQPSECWDYQHASPR
jgi:hypothetical protein